MTEEEKQEREKAYLQRLDKVVKNQSAQLIADIKEAFANVPYPGDENLIDNEHRATCEECQEIYTYFIGKLWENCLDEESSIWVSHAQCFFTPLAWQYYLPAYLIDDIQKKYFSNLSFRPSKISDFEEDDFSESDFIEFWNGYEQPRIDILSTKQCKVIVNFLEAGYEICKGGFKHEEGDAQEALEFWKENYQKALAKEQNL